jgi:hypothetical protein
MLRPRALILCLVVLAAGCSTEIASMRSDPVTRPVRVVDPFLDTLQERTFDWFWEFSDATNGLVRDRAPSPSFASIAAVGFGLTAYPIGVERGYVTREEAGGERWRRYVISGRRRRARSRRGRTSGIGARISTFWTGKRGCATSRRSSPPSTRRC